MPALDERKVLFFLLGPIPTATEAALIARIRGKVGIRNGAADATFGGKLEACDAMAGLAIPTAYANADPAILNITPALTARPEAIKVIPATGSIAGAGTLQLRLAAVEVSDVNGDATITDATAAATVGWVSGTTGTCTIGATTGLVTRAGAGSSTITATYTTPAVKSALTLSAFGDGKLDTIIEATTAGKIGDEISVSLVGDSTTTVSITRATKAFVIHYKPGTSTVANVESAITALSGGDDLFGVKTGGTGATVLTVDSAFFNKFLDGGADLITQTSTCAMTCT